MERTSTLEPRRVLKPEFIIVFKETADGSRSRPVSGFKRYCAFGNLSILRLDANPLCILIATLHLCLSLTAVHCK